MRQVTERVRALLEQGFGTVCVEGEIANLSRPASGHIYFSLRDADGQATLGAVLFRNATFRLPAGFEPRDGIEVVACGKISVYAPRGGYQLVVEKMFPKGLGLAELALRELREKLFRLGYFDVKRKKPLPRFPRTICLISSATSAAIRDMIEILGRRWPIARVVVQPTLVQGGGSAEQIAEGIRTVNRWKERKLVQIDVIILGRGGGSAEDLSAFNTETVAQAIFESRIPVVSAVGHEVDVTIADTVADVRASTPSHAAELTVPDRADILNHLQKTECRIHDSIRRQVLLVQRRLDELACRRGFQLPLERVHDLERGLDDIGQRIQRAAQVHLMRDQQSLAALAARLEALSPLNVLARGYSLTRNEAQRGLIRSADHVQPGDRIITTVHRGEIVSRVEAVELPPKLP
ncbi:MAG TPA: exodeoxyribonuclease VII large subunit [Gemmataceae bacterium]|nr:exodeoxyribonuclease VII large subunit [Gemmataceae bacterium]